MRTLLIPLLIICAATISGAEGACPIGSGAQAGCDAKPGCEAKPGCVAKPENTKPASTDITVGDLKTAIAAQKVVLLDANGSESFAKGRLPGAIDFKANANDLAKVLPADKNALIVAYCGGPKCGAWKAAAKAATALGYTNVKHFSGGLAGWKEAGEQLVAAK